MFKLAFFTIFALIAVAASEVQIPERLRNAKDISFHPLYQQTLERKFPKSLNDVPTKNPYIIGGSVAQRGQIPHHVLVFLFDNYGNSYLCGGSLIQRDWVLTAAHCAYNMNHLEVYLGVASLEGPASYGERIEKSEIFVHPEYDFNWLANDIAVAKLINVPENILSDPYIDVINLPYVLVNTDVSGSIGTIAGFGLTSDENPQISQELKYNSLRAITNFECSKYYLEGLVRDTNICAETSSQASTCQGDSGGSYTFKINGETSIVGVTSFGAAVGCEKGYPVGFARVTEYLGWIDTIINGTTPTPPPETDLRNILREILRRIMEIIFGRSLW